MLPSIKVWRNIFLIDISFPGEYIIIGELPEGKKLDRLLENTLKRTNFDDPFSNLLVISDNKFIKFTKHSTLSFELSTFSKTAQFSNHHQQIIFIIINGIFSKNIVAYISNPSNHRWTYQKYKPIKILNQDEEKSQEPQLKKRIEEQEDKTATPEENPKEPEASEMLAPRYHPHHPHPHHHPHHHHHGGAPEHHALGPPPPQQQQQHHHFAAAYHHQVSTEIKRFAFLRFCYDIFRYEEMHTDIYISCRFFTTFRWFFTNRRFEIHFWIDCMENLYGFEMKNIVFIFISNLYNFHVLFEHNWVILFCCRYLFIESVLLTVLFAWTFIYNLRTICDFYLTITWKKSSTLHST